MRARLSLIAVVLLAATAPVLGGVTFASPPTATRDGDKVTIKFAVSEKTDVEVAILNGEGNVVRHLAAGLLGGLTPPPAPLAAGLEQTISWDGTHDLGQPAGKGPFTVRVRLGTDVKLDGFFAENPTLFAAFWGMATDAKGQLYILGASTGNKGPDGTRYMQVFDRDGKYLRTIMPMPANLKADQAAPFAVVPSPDGGFTPRNYRGTWPVLYPGLGMNIAMDTRVGEEGVLWMTDGRSVARVRNDGSGVGKRFARDPWGKSRQPSYGAARYNITWSSDMAVAPDGKTVYLAGIFQHKPEGKNPLMFPPGMVYKSAPEGELETLAEVKRADDKPARFNGIACDGDGNVLLCDAADGRIVVLDPAGKQVGQVKVDSPQDVIVHRKTGNLYVLSLKSMGPADAWSVPKKLLKLSPWKEGGKELTQFPLRDAGRGTVFAVDESAEVPVIWVGIDRNKGGDAYKLATPAAILRIEDRDNKLVETPHAIKLQQSQPAVVTRLAAHPDSDVVVCRGEYATGAAYQGLTGEPVKAPFNDCVDMAVGKDGYFYVQVNYGWDGPLCKFDSQLNPVTVDPDRKPNNMVLPRVFGRYGNGFGVAGISTDANGRLVIAQQLDEQTISGDCVTAFSAEGKPEDPGRMKDEPRFKKHNIWPSALIGPIASVVGGVAVDNAGYVYLSIRGLPLDHKAPAGFEKDTGYNWIVGSVVKFKPEGGSVFLTGGPTARPPMKEKPIPEGMTGIRLTKLAGYPCGPLFAENAVAAYPGIGSMSGGYGAGCRCRQPMFHLDEYGRLFVPNAVTCSVQVFDNAGNVISTFGRYGNLDSTGPKGAVPTPAIPLGWPEAVSVTPKSIYVADVLNRRIVRTRRTWAAEASCPVK